MFTVTLQKNETMTKKILSYQCIITRELLEVSNTDTACGFWLIPV